MCPDRQIISTYLDGELLSPWKEKMEAHLNSCPKCQAILAKYKKLKGCFLDSAQENMEAARERVWEKLNNPVFAGAQLANPVRKEGRLARLWRKNITLPLPAAAAAAIVILLAFFALMGLERSRATLPLNAVASGIGLDDQGMIHTQDAAEVLRHISTLQTGEFMVVRLPEHRRLSRSGEPVLMNAAAYSRRNTFR